jgi:hypothetical protein
MQEVEGEVDERLSPSTAEARLPIDVGRLDTLPAHGLFTT